MCSLVARESECPNAGVGAPTPEYYRWLAARHLELCNFAHSTVQYQQEQLYVLHDVRANRLNWLYSMQTHAPEQETLVQKPFQCFVVVAVVVVVPRNTHHLRSPRGVCRTQRNKQQRAGPNFSHADTDGRIARNPNAKEAAVADGASSGQ